MSESQREVIQRLEQIAELHNTETGLHLARMSHYCKALGRALGLEAEECEMLFQASPLHDIGMIGIPSRILAKPGPLDESEWSVLKTHTEMGGTILSGSQSSVLQMAETIALSHHERWDGTGYPYGLKAEAIPLVGRIVAICDAFDALTTERLYKGAWSTADAIRCLDQDAGTHFSPKLVDVFKSTLPEIVQFKERFSEPCISKGIVLFDIRNFLYQGMDPSSATAATITDRQAEMLRLIHADMLREQERRRIPGATKPTIDLFLPTGDGYYMLCEPDVSTILGIAESTMALWRARDIDAYCVAHRGEVHTFSDLTGRRNATGFDLGLASRLLSLAKTPGRLIVSEAIVAAWEDTPAFQLKPDWHTGIAKDGVEYRWKSATLSVDSRLPT